MCLICFLAINAKAQYQYLLDSVGTYYKPIIRNWSDSLKTAKDDLYFLKIKNAGIAKNPNDAYTALITNIHKYEDSLKQAKDEYGYWKKAVVVQYNKYTKQQDYYRYKRVSKYANIAGYVSAATFLCLLVPAMGEAPDDPNYNKPNLAIPIFIALGTSGGSFLVSGIYSHKYKRHANADNGFQLSIHPNVQLLNGNSLGLNLRMNF